MKRRSLSLLVTLFAAVVLLAAPPVRPQKMSAWVKHLAADSRKLTAFVRTADDDVLNEYGCKVHARLGDICIASIPVNRLQALAQHPAVQRIEASPSAQLTLDEVVKVDNVSPAYEGTTVPAFTGRGVVMGIQDVGFDLTHPNFFADNARTDYRIKAFWDQLAGMRDYTPPTDGTAEEGGDDRLPVGREYVTAADILALGCSTDGYTQQHGTHTTGIAAGSGHDTPWRGIAWESDICLVANAITDDTIYIDRRYYDKYTSATDALGFKYCFDYAAAHGMPCVVSFSEGYTPYFDEDDLLFSEFLSRLTGPGRILVASAGNESRYLTYFEKPAGSDEAGSFVYSWHERARYRVLSDGTPTLQLQAYDGQHQQLTFTTSGEWTEEAIVDTMFFDKDTCAVSVSRYPSAMIEGRTIYEVTLSSNRMLAHLPSMAIIVRGADCEAMLYGSSSSALQNLETDTRWNAALRGRNILAPGCLDAVLCVGSTSHRIEYTDIEGKPHTSSDVPGLWSPFSSTGPSLNGLQKPNVTAAGLNVLSSLSSYYFEKVPAAIGAHVRHTVIDGRTYPWGANSGTSMSTPVVSGAIALWLQANPQLTPADVLGVLERTCQHPEADLTYPNERYGYGEIDVYRGLLDVLGASGIEQLSTHQPQGVTINVKNGQLCLTFQSQPQSPVDVTVYSLDGRQLHHTTIDPSMIHGTWYMVHCPLSIVNCQLSIVQVRSKEKALTGSELIRW